jgi:membrane carboxypeptidase/penicillin-binding protein
MKSLLKIAFAFFVLVVVVIAGILGRLFFYQGDLPDVGLLGQFAPDAPGIVSTPCLSRPTAVVPARDIGKGLRDAIETAESERIRSFDVAQFLLCGSQRRGNLRFALDQYRLIPRIHWRFTKDQILAIYMNRAYFGDDTHGVGDASRHFFGKKPDNLSLAEAALLAGMIRAGDALSPYRHSDRALRRRNQVIEAMRAQGLITEGEASAAEVAPIDVLPLSTK